MIVQLKFKFVYFEAAVQHLSHHDIRTPYCELLSITVNQYLNNGIHDRRQ